MPGKLKYDDNFEFNLSFNPDEIRQQYELSIKEGPKQHSTDTYSSRRQKKTPVKTKAIVAAVSLIAIFLTYNEYSKFLAEKEQRAILEAEEKSKLEQEKLLAEQKKQDLDANKNLNNAKVAIDKAEEMKVDKNKSAASFLQKAKEEYAKAEKNIKSKKYEEAITSARIALGKAKDAISIYEEQNPKKASKKEKAEKVAKAVKKPKKKKEEKSQKTKKKAAKEKEAPKEKKAEEKKEPTIDHEKYRGQAEVLFKAIEKTLSDENEIKLIKKHLTGKYSKVKKDLETVKENIDKGEFKTAAENAEEIQYRLKKLKEEADEEELGSEKKRKEALKKILEAQQKLKQKRLKKGK